MSKGATRETTELSPPSPLSPPPPLRPSVPPLLYAPQGQHNDARMNLAIALTATRHGAAVANYTEVVRLLKKNDPETGKEKVCGARCRDVVTGTHARLCAHTHTCMSTGDTLCLSYLFPLSELLSHTHTLTPHK